MSSFRENMTVRNDGPAVSDIKAAQEDTCGEPSNFCQKHSLAIIITGLLIVIAMVTYIGVYIDQFKALGPMGTLLTIFSLFAISSSLGYVAGGCKFHKKIKKSLLNQEPKIHDKITNDPMMLNVAQAAQAVQAEQDRLS